MENEMEDVYRMENKMESLEGCEMEQQWKTQCVFHVFPFRTLLNFPFGFPCCSPSRKLFHFVFRFLSTPKDLHFLFKNSSIPSSLWLRGRQTEWKTNGKQHERETTEWKTKRKDISLKWKHDEPTVGGVNFHNLGNYGAMLYQGSANPKSLNHKPSTLDFCLSINKREMVMS